MTGLNARFFSFTSLLRLDSLKQFVQKKKLKDYAYYFAVKKRY